MNATKNISKILTVILLTVVFLNPAAYGQFFFMKNENIGKPIKDFTLKTVNGKETSLSAYRDGKRTIVFFWATWCPHCRVELGHLSENKEEIEKKNIKIALVDIGESAAVVDNYLKKNNIRYDVFLDVDSQVAEEYDLVGVPTFYFVKEDGTVADVQHSLPKDLEKAFTKS